MYLEMGTFVISLYLNKKRNNEKRNNKRNERERVRQKRNSVRDIERKMENFKIERKFLKKGKENISRKLLLALEI